MNKKRPAEREPVQRVSRSKRRTCLTHVAFLCDRDEIQPLLPQVVIGNEATLPAAAMERLRSALPENVRLVRQKSAWNDRLLCAIIVRMLAHALRPYKDRYQPVLLLDAVRLHFAQVVLNACNNCGIWVVLVPAKTTWLLQPLDTHAFREFKEFLRKAYQKARVAAAASDLSIEQFLPCVCDAIRNVLQGRSWCSAFDNNGFGFQQARVSEHIKRELDMAGPLQAPVAQPSLEQFVHVFPRRTVVPSASLLRPFQVVPFGKAASKASALRVTAPAMSKALPESLFRLGRTRSQHHRAAAAEGMAASSSSGEAKAVGPVVAIGHRLKLPKARAVAEGF